MADAEDDTLGMSSSARRASTERCAPYDKQPTIWDVSEAHSVPDAAFMEKFKESLIQSEDARGCEMLIADSTLSVWHEGRDRISSTSSATWPAAVVIDLPDKELSSIQNMARWRLVFDETFGRHLYVSGFQLERQLRDNALSPPYLDFALACVASPLTSQVHVGLGGGALPADSYFDIGVKLYIFTLEVDNREARTIESVIASALSATFGLLSADIMRRLRTFNHASMSETSRLNAQRHSVIVSYKYLVDVLLAVHIGTIPVLSTAELNIKLPVSGHKFPTIYRILMQSNGSMPDDVKEPEDAVLLLTAILSDMLFIQRNACRLGLAQCGSPSQSSHTNAASVHQNPHQTLSLSGEAHRQRLMIKRALGRWFEHFETSMPQDIIALYYFCQLCLVHPDIWCLSLLAGYPPAMQSHANLVLRPTYINNVEASASEEAMGFAFLVLDNISTFDSADGVKCGSIWNPVVLFYSALVVWSTVTRRSPQLGPGTRRGTVKVLDMFSRKLEQLLWPCCPIMVQTLEHLMTAGK